MNVALVVNPQSGRGRAAAVAQVFQSALQDAGHAVFPTLASRDLDIEPAADVIAIVGGDGTVHHVAPHAISLDRPVYHVPLGTENLFARQFRMSRDPARFIDALRRLQILRSDVAYVSSPSNAQVLPPATQTRSAASYFPANSLVPRMQRQPPSQVGVRDPALPTAFFLMLSVGPDAAVVHRLAAARTGAIGHWSYLRPILSEMLAPTLRPLTVHADGSRLFHARTGLLVIANSPQYGVRINPAARASISDGLLDIVFFPAESAAELVVWAARARLRSHLRSRRLLYHTAREVTLHCDDGAAPYQLDGEAGRYIDSPSQPLTIRLRPAALKVLDAATPGAT